MSRLPCAYGLGTVVYRRLDRDAVPGTVVEVVFGLGGETRYTVRWMDGEGDLHSVYEAEISTVKNYTPEEESA